MSELPPDDAWDERQRMPSCSWGWGDERTLKIVLLLAALYGLYLLTR